ncbi:reverse transcriptase domain-containing protein [Tanacetum coccineum]
MTSKEKDSTSIRRIDPVNTPYSEKKPELEKISEEEKSSLLQVLEKLKEAEDLATYHLSYNIIRRYVAGSETFEILAHCHSGPTDGHHSANITAKKVYESRFYWPSVFKDANEEIIGYNPKGWSEKLNDALWAFRTAYKTLTGCTPFRLVYGKACHLPVEIKHKAHWALKQCNMDLTLASKSHLMQLNELAELRDGAISEYKILQEQTRNGHVPRLCGDKDFKGTVLASNSIGNNRLKEIIYRGDIDKEDDEVIELENDATRS